MHLQKLTASVALTAMLLCVGCAVTKQVKYTPADFPSYSVLSDEQWELLAKSDEFRNKLLWEAKAREYPGVRTDMEWEDMLPIFIQHLKLRQDGTWDDVLAHPDVQAELHEEKRQRYVKAFKEFGTNDTSDWLAINRAMKEARARAAAIPITK